jgi:hypothetical protein
MAKKANGVNKSEEIRQILKANPKIKTKEIAAALGEKGIKVSENLIYLVKGTIRGRRGRKKTSQQAVAKVAAATGSVDALSTILKVKSVAGQVGGLKKLKALVEALSE